MSRSVQNLTVAATGSLTNAQVDTGRLIICGTAAENTQTLPDNPADGQSATFLREGANNLILLPGALPAGTTIGGAANYTVVSDNDTVTIKYDITSNEWKVIGALAAA